MPAIRVRDLAREETSRPARLTAHGAVARLVLLGYSTTVTVALGWPVPALLRAITR
jgi:hypothetical protein